VKIKIKCLIAALFLSVNLNAQPLQTIVIKVNKPVADIQPTMWGIFFEDINLAADGGIYAELVKTVLSSLRNH